MLSDHESVAKLLEYSARVKLDYVVCHAVTSCKVPMSAQRVRVVETAAIL